MGIINLFVFIVMNLEIFHVYRIMTASSVGFDFAKSYYMNPRITILRHCAMRIFFLNVPALCVAVAIKCWVHLAKESVIHAAITASILAVGSLLLMMAYYEHRHVFQDTHDIMVNHQKPLLSRMTEEGQFPREMSAWSS